MQIDLPYADLSASQNVEELRVQLNDYLYRLREAIEIAIDMELASQTVVSDSVTRLELRQLSDQIISDANAIVRASIADVEIRLSDKLSQEISEQVSKKQDSITDLDEIRSGARSGATAIQTESDPTVPAWAKKPSKPTYTASEVGALPANTPLFSGDYNDLENKPTIFSGITLSINYETGVLSYELSKGE